MISATISYPYDGRLEALFSAEQKESAKGRYTLEHHGDYLVFSVQASDATALRAYLTTITKILSVWEISSLDGTARAGNNRTESS
jgi:hypothetical protein